MSYDEDIQAQMAAAAEHYANAMNRVRLAHFKVQEAMNALRDAGDQERQALRATVAALGVASPSAIRVAQAREGEASAAGINQIRMSLSAALVGTDEVNAILDSCWSRAKRASSLSPGI